MKIFRKLSSVVFLGLFMAGFVITSLPISVDALKANEEAAYDYDAAVASQILLACTVNTSINKGDMGKATWGDRGRKYQVSAVWSGALDTTVEGEIDCNTPKDMEAVVSVFGFTSIEDYNKFVTNNCTSDTCNFRDNWKQAVFDKARENKGRPGPDNTITSVSSAGQYYFWSRMFKDGSCGGNVYAQQATYDNKPEDQRTAGPVYWVENGVVTEKIGAGFKKLNDDMAYIELGPDYFSNETVRIMTTEKAPADTNLAWYSDPSGDNKYTCADIIGKLKGTGGKALADSYAALVAEKEASGVAADMGGQNIAFENIFDEESGDGEKSCTERFMLSSGWIVCSILELLSNGVDTLMNFVDSMLNVDSQALGQSNELRQVWSYFRVIATFALLAIGLVMVISQAIGGN